jgi:hypothetical protein
MGKRRNISLLRLGIALALASVAAACTKGGQFDPTVLLDNDMFDSKKPLQGQREQVFPNGVPGATTGIPADLYKGYQPPPEQPAETAATPILPPEAEPAKPEAKAEPKPKPKRKVARASAPPRTEISIGLAKRPKPATQQQTHPAQTAWPAPPSTSAAQSQTVWPAPPSTTSTQSQTVWPAPPSTAAAQPQQSIWPNPPPTGTSTQ